ncbi:MULTISPECIES: YceI family protein [Streptacidiphilus]|uniref:YceI family protein n=2 Tax=Streptacidiphilus TaxID=228398 RepID=A0ABV6UT66_9ACTN|nr:YceI family protein [Streptacidiphilus jeojiense]
MSSPTPAAATTALSDLPTGRYLLDRTRSEVRIQHKTMWGLVTVKGGFSEFSGEGEIPADGSPARGTLTVDAASLDTSHAKRDAHLRSDDFFATDQHPTLSFTADRAEAKADGAVQVSGSLTVRGRTQPLEFTARPSAVGADSVTLTAELTVDRDAHGLGWNKLGMLKGLTGVTVNATFVHQA